MGDLVEDADRLLVHSYWKANASVSAELNMHQVAVDLTWELSRVADAWQYLRGCGLVEPIAIGGDYALTAPGIDAVEQKVNPNLGKGRQALEFLERAFESAPPPHRWVAWQQVGEELDMPPEVARDIVLYLHQKGFLGAHSALTQAAVDLFVRAQARPESPTGSIPPSSSLNIRDSTFVASNVGSPGGTVHTGDITVRIGRGSDLDDAFSILEQAITGSGVDDDTKHDALSDIAALKAQSEKTAPNPGVAKAIWHSLVGSVPTIIDQLVKSGRISDIVNWIRGG